MANKLRSSFRLPSRYGFFRYSLYRKCSHRKYVVETVRRNMIRHRCAVMGLKSTSSKDTLRPSESQDQCQPQSSKSSPESIDSSFDLTNRDETFPLERYKVFQSFPLLNWSKLHSNAAQYHAKTGQLVAQQEEVVNLANAIDMMQNLTITDINRIFAPGKFSMSISAAKHLCGVENRDMDTVELLAEALRNYWFDSLELKVGDYFMHVDRYMFGYFMQTFKDYNNLTLELPTDKIKISLLIEIYNWMLSDNEGLMLGDSCAQIYSMAKYLDARLLLEQFWDSFSFDGTDIVMEEDAFKAYLLSRRIASDDLMAIFFPRIRKCFLPLVASMEFVNLKPKEVKFLLSTDFLYVSSEDEVFYAAVRWLDYDWENREQYLLDVMSSVRFRLLSADLQHTISYEPENEIIRKVSENHILKAILWNASMVSLAIFAAKETPELLEDALIQRFIQMKDADRYWAFCPGVPHHHDPKCCRFQKLSYRIYLQFLNVMQYTTMNYMDTVEHVPNKYSEPFNCCPDAEMPYEVSYTRRIRKIPMAPKDRFHFKNDY